MKIFSILAKIMDFFYINDIFFIGVLFDEIRPMTCLVVNQKI